MSVEVKVQAIVMVLLRGLVLGASTAILRLDHGLCGKITKYLHGQAPNKHNNNQLSKLHVIMPFKESLKPIIMTSSVISK